MLGIFLIYWIGRKFYDLAFLHHRSQWGWAIFGIIIYFVSQIIFGMLIGIVAPNLLNDTGGSFVVNILGIGIGLGVWFIVFKFLEKSWDNNDYKRGEIAIEAIGKISRDSEEEEEGM